MKRTEIGFVVKKIGMNTVRVEIARQFSHPVYGKIVKSRTICYAHDENASVGVGDVVEIVESRPMSRLKRWWVSRIVAGVASNEGYCK